MGPARQAIERHQVNEVVCADVQGLRWFPESPEHGIDQARAEGGSGLPLERGVRSCPGHRDAARLDRRTEGGAPGGHEAIKLRRRPQVDSHGDAIGPEHVREESTGPGHLLGVWIVLTIASHAQVAHRHASLGKSAREHAGIDRLGDDTVGCETPAQPAFGRVALQRGASHPGGVLLGGSSLASRAQNQVLQGGAPDSDLPGGFAQRGVARNQGRTPRDRTRRKPARLDEIENSCFEFAACARAHQEYRLQPGCILGERFAGLA
jgi:hypothetical protein